MTPAQRAVVDCIRQAAKAGRRCPENGDLQSIFYDHSGSNWGPEFKKLTTTGVLKIEIAGQNWRVITIVAEGLSTAPEPNGAHTWRVIDASGTRKAG